MEELLEFDFLPDPQLEDRQRINEYRLQQDVQQNSYKIKGYIKKISSKPIRVKSDPPRKMVHWDYLCEEALYMAMDFMQERRHKQQLASSIARQIAGQLDQTPPLYEEIVDKLQDYRPFSSELTEPLHPTLPVEAVASYHRLPPAQESTLKPVFGTDSVVIKVPPQTTSGGTFSADDDATIIQAKAYSFNWKLLAELTQKSEWDCYSRYMLLHKDAELEVFPEVHDIRKQASRHAHFINAMLKFTKKRDANKQTPALKKEVVLQSHVSHQSIAIKAGVTDVVKTVLEHNERRAANQVQQKKPIVPVKAAPVQSPKVAQSQLTPQQLQSILVRQQMIRQQQMQQSQQQSKFPQQAVMRSLLPMQSQHPQLPQLTPAQSMALAQQQQQQQLMLQQQQQQQQQQMQQSQPSSDKKTKKPKKKKE